LALPAWLTADAVAVFFQVVLIDLALAGDNAVAIGISAAGLPQPQRRRAIILGLALSTLMLIGFALVARQLLALVGLVLAGGLLLLWVCWKMWRELSRGHDKAEAEGERALEPHSRKSRDPARPKTLGQALVQILAADLTMSLDNVLAVAGAAREHPFVMMLGLAISITLTGVAAAWIARLLHRMRWIGYLGLATVLYVAVRMIWDGSWQVAHHVGAAVR
jgi:YjbE family integral membrane protein